MSISRVTKYDQLAKTSDLSMGINGSNKLEFHSQDMNNYGSSTANSFNKPPQSSEISSVRNQLKLIKAGSRDREELALDRDMTAFQTEISDLDQRQREAGYASKPIVPRNRSIPNKRDDASLFSSSFQTSNLNRNPFQFNSNSNSKEIPDSANTAQSIQSQAQGAMINMSRRRRDVDTVGSENKVQGGGLELYLPDDTYSKQNVISMLNSNAEDFLDPQISQPQSNQQQQSSAVKISALKQTIGEIKNIQQQQQQQQQQQYIKTEHINTIKNVQKPILKQEEQKMIPQREDEDLYMPSVTNVEKQKRTALPGSKNVIDDRPAIAVKDFQEKMKEAELQQPLEDEELALCPEGCGRSFNTDAFEKHVKVCRAVFQQKRKEFNSKSHRIVNQEQQKLARQGLIKEKQVAKQMQKTQTGGKKWKEQSEQFRNIIKNVKHYQILSLQQDPSQEPK